MEVALKSPSPGLLPRPESDVEQPQDVSRQVWDFVESQCFVPGSNSVDTANVTFWLRTLLQQNSDLVEVVAKLEEQSRSTGNGKEREEERLIAEREEREREERVKELEARLQQSEGDNKASELLCEVLTDRVKEGERKEEELQQEVAFLEEDNRNLKEYTENLRSDIDSLLKLSCRARDTGVWDPHDLNFCEVTFEQVFGTMEATADLAKPVVRKVGQEEEVRDTEAEEEAGRGSSQLLYDSRSSLRSELSDLRRRSQERRRGGEALEGRTETQHTKIRELRQQVLKHQGKASEYVREGVQRNKVIAELQAQITELNSEMDELKEENNANLSVINRLKDSLHEQAARLMGLEDLEDPGAPLSSPRHTLLSSTASLPSLPSAPCQHGPDYSSKFARSLSRRSSQSSLVTQLGEQLETARSEARCMEQRAQQLLTQAECAAAERLQAEAALLGARRELQELAGEHENLKDDFRALVRSKEERKVRRSPSKAGEEGRRGQEGLDVRLGAAIQQLQQREEEMERVAGALDSVTLQLYEREVELSSLRGRVALLEEQLEEQLEAGDRQRETMGQLQGALEARSRGEAGRRPSVPLPVRVIYKAESEVSLDKDEEDDDGRSRSRTPGSFLLSSSDSFNI